MSLPIQLNLSGITMNKLYLDKECRFYMNTKELYCLNRAQQLSKMLGISLTAAWMKAEEEWCSGRPVSIKQVSSYDEYDDDMEDLD